MSERFYIRAHAPFAAFRWMQAGVYRATAPVIPPSTAWGLVCNFACFDRGEGPRMRVAIGNPAKERPTVGTLFQQLHSYPVGDSGKELKAKCQGQKYWISTAKREVISDFNVVIGVEADGLRARLLDGLAGRLPRYGAPFAGDNGLLIDRVTVLDEPVSAWWYVPVTGASTGSHKLTIGIDRADSSKTTTGLYAPVDSDEVPDAAWTSVG